MLIIFQICVKHFVHKVLY